MIGAKSITSLAFSLFPVVSFSERYNTIVVTAVETLEERRPDLRELGPGRGLVDVDVGIGRPTVGMTHLLLQYVDRHTASGGQRGKSMAEGMEGPPRFLIAKPA
jgi:hypothetical protein